MIQRPAFLASDPRSSEPTAEDMARRLIELRDRFQRARPKKEPAA